MPPFSQDFDVISKKKKFSVFHMLICQCLFDGPSEAHWLSAGPPEANGLLKVHGPKGNSPPSAPPFVGPAYECIFSL